MRPRDPGYKRVHWLVVYILALIGLLTLQARADDVYKIRYDSPQMQCSFGGAGSCRCEAQRVYPATPTWTISHGNSIIATGEALVFYFETEPREWYEISMEVVRWDGELVHLNMAIIHDNQRYYHLSLNHYTEFEGRTPPPWALELPDYQRYYEDRVSNLPNE